MLDQQTHVDAHLAFRTEGQMFNAYLEWQGTAAAMQLVGSISQAMCHDDPMVYATWRRLMALAVCRFGERISGEPTEFIGRRTVPVGGSA